MQIKFSLLALLVANLVPLIGVLFFAWDLVLVLALFWIENIIIGVFNLLKMLLVAVRNNVLKSLFLSAFFILHYGIFTAAHGQLLANVLGLSDKVAWNSDFADQFGPFSLFFGAADLLAYFVALYSPVILLGIFGLVLSHSVSFIENFILKGAMFTQTSDKLMGRPYKHIIVMHAGLMLGAIVMQKFGSSIWLLAILVGLKIAVDFVMHKRRHKQTIDQELIKDL